MSLRYFRWFFWACGSQQLLQALPLSKGEWRETRATLVIQYAQSRMSILRGRYGGEPSADAGALQIADWTDPNMEGEAKMLPQPDCWRVPR